MTTTIVTRHFTAGNVASRYAVGNFEHEGNAAAYEVTLPAGYTLADGTIYDAAGFACTIVDDDGPVLMSLAGASPSHRLTLD